MKIVFFIDHLRADGTQHFLLQLTEGLARRGYEQAVVCLNDSFEPTIVNQLRRTGLQVRVVGKVALASIYGLITIYFWLKAERFDVAVTMLFAADVIGRLLAKVSGIRRIITSLRARNVHYSLLQRLLVRVTVKIAGSVIINSPHTEEFASTVEGVRPDRIVFVPNGIKVESYSQEIDRASIRAEFGVLTDVCLLGTVGRLTKQKGVDTLLYALSYLKAERINLFIIGVGEQETKLRELATQLNLESRVHFLGYRLDIPKLLRILDVYVHPARFEGMPNAVLEAMAAACPIVASGVDGIRELIEDGVHGWLVLPENPVLLANTIKEVLSNPDEACRRGNLARQRVIQQFSVDSMVTAWEAVLLNSTINLQII